MEKDTKGDGYEGAEGELVEKHRTQRVTKRFIEIYYTDRLCLCLTIICRLFQR